MRAFKLYNKLTLGNKLFVVGLAMSLSSTAHSVELATTLSDVQHQANRCDTSTTNWRDSQKDFALACSEAGLGGVKNCTSKLEKCESKSDKPSYCIGSATARDQHKENLKEKEAQEDKLQERKDKLIADYQEKEAEIQKAKESKDSIQTALENTLAKVDAEKVQAQLRLENELLDITEKMALTRDDIAIARLELRDAAVKNDLACRTEALAEKNRYIEMTRANKGRLTVNQLFGRTGLSVNQAGSIRYEQVMRNCNAWYTDTGKQTAFGKVYQQQQKVIKVREDKLKRQLVTYEQRKARVAKNTKKALAMMDQQKQMAFRSSKAALHRADQNVVLLQSQRNDIIAQVNQLEGKINILGHQVSAEQVGMVTSLADQLRGTRQKAEQKIKVADQKKIDAFNKALGLKDTMGFAEGDKKDICSTQKENTEVTAALEDKINVSGVADSTTATATEVPSDSTERTPAASTSTTTASSTVGETL